METLETGKSRTIQSISSYFGGDDEDDIPDMTEFNDHENILEADAVSLYSHAIVTKTNTLNSCILNCNVLIFFVCFLQCC